MSCASCGIAEVDDIKLKKCDDCDLVVRYIAVINVRRNIARNVNRSVKSEPLNYEKRFCSSSPRAATSGTARSAICRSHVIRTRPL